MTPCARILSRIHFVIVFSMMISSLHAQVGKVGINTLTPTAMLTVKDSNVVFTGINPLPVTPGNPPVSGAGTRMMWYPDKGSFRVGTVTGTQWNRDSIGINSMAFGKNTKAKGLYSFAMGSSTLATADYATAMGSFTEASGIYSTAIGNNTTASGTTSTAMGSYAKATGSTSTAMGSNTIASGNISTAMGDSTRASGIASTAMGKQTEAVGDYSTAMGNQTVATGDYSTTMGDNTEATNEYAIAMGSNTLATGIASTAMGYATEAIGDYSTAMGFNTHAIGDKSTALGQWSTASGSLSTAMGFNTHAIGENSTSLGELTMANGSVSTAMGYSTQANGSYATATGYITLANGLFSTAMGRETNAAGTLSIAMGEYTISKPYASLTLGKYNDTTSISSTTWNVLDPVFIIGNGTFNGARSNAFTVLKNGKTGINTASPDAMLHVVKDGTSGGVLNTNAAVIIESNQDAYLQFSSGSNDDCGIISGNGITSIQSGILFPHDSTILIRAGGNSTKIFVDNNGNIGIGTITPSQKLNVVGNGLFTGTVTASCGVLVCSDIRYKKDILPLTNALQSLQSIHGIYYNWNKEKFVDKAFDDRHQIGFSAQELELVYPDMVHTDDDGYKSVDYSRLTPVLVEAIKEQQTMILEQQKQIDILFAALSERKQKSGKKMKPG